MKKAISLAVFLILALFALSLTSFADGTADTTFYIGNEENPNTGAPDFGAAIGALTVIAAAAAIKKH